MNGHGETTFGMPTLIENRDIEENARLCHRLGLKFIELNMNFPEYQTDRLEKTDELLAAAERYGLFYTIHLDENLNIADFNPLVREAYLETVRRTVRTAAKLKAPVINMHMNHGIHITLPDRKVQLYERDFDTYIRFFREFRDLCTGETAGTGIRIAVENTDGFRDYEREAIGLLLQSPVFGLTWDIGHSKAVNETDEAFLMQHEEALIHFHIHDGTTQPPANHLALGDGAIDLEARLDLAARLGCRCVLETKTVRALESSVGWLRNRGYLRTD